MFARSAKRLAPRQLPNIFVRRLSIKTRYSSLFPATLHHYRTSDQIFLYNEKEGKNRPHDLFEDSVVVNENGLVYPSLIETPGFVSNGAVMYPNTFDFQEMARQYFDDALDREHDGIQVEIPFIFTVSKGTPIPSSLTLVHFSGAHFALQPSYGMPLKDLNGSLGEFYANHASKEKAGNWLDQHPYPNAIPDDQESKWMVQ